jgi:hypothetical protein
MGEVMNRFIALFIFLSAAAVLSASSAWAEASCSVWMWQSDGVYWQQCVNDDGSRHCYRATDASGSGAVEISCS